MTTINFDAQTTKLHKAVTRRLVQDGSEICAKIYNAALPLPYWLDYLRTSEATGCCDEFLDGFRAGIVETTGCLAMGLVRPTIFSLRGQLDLALSWLYFKDHPIEWNRVQESGEGFMLKRDVLAYLEEYYAAFKIRFGALQSARTRQEMDPYRLLSAHVHGQNSLVMPLHEHLDTLVRPRKRCLECIQLQAEITEYLSDVLLACFADKWASLPEPIVDAARTRLDPKKLAKVFA
jgi:hypothetical protein